MAAMKSLIICALPLLTCASLCRAGTTIILDFGTAGSGVWTDSGTNRTYNAVTTAAGLNGVANNNIYTSGNLTSVVGGSTGWSVVVSKPATAGDIGSQGLATWSGSPATAAAPFAGEAANALQDGFYINNNATLVITFSGLTVGQAYDLAAFGALTGTTTPANFSLTTGTSASSTVQSLDLDTAAGTGLSAIWANVAPDASGVIAFSVNAVGGTSGRRTELNAVRLEAVPEPATYGLFGAAAGAAAIVIRRRRSR